MLCGERNLPYYFMKQDFYIDKVTKKQAEKLLLEYHYLKDISKRYRSGKNFGLFKKNDFYYADGTKHSRGKVKGVEGGWKYRSRKHRYVMIFDKNLNLLW